MRRPAAAFTFALAFGVISLAPVSVARSQTARGEGPIEIEKCQTINKPGSYKLVKNITATGTTGICLPITADLVTLDLAGFTISGPSNAAAIAAVPPSGGQLFGIAVRNGSISNFSVAVSFGISVAEGTVVEGLRVFGGPPCEVAILNTGITRNNTVSGCNGGIAAGGTVVGNNSSFNGGTGITVSEGSTIHNVANFNKGNGISLNPGSTAIGNTAFSNGGQGFSVSCPSNLTDNTAVNNAGGNLVLNGDGCHSEDNLAP
jgi:hypothetical protein